MAGFYCLKFIEFIVINWATEISIFKVRKYAGLEEGDE